MKKKSKGKKERKKMIMISLVKRFRKKITTKSLILLLCEEGLLDNFLNGDQVFEPLLNNTDDEFLKT